jgi:hypothetical protein
MIALAAAVSQAALVTKVKPLNMVRAACCLKIVPRYL